MNIVLINHYAGYPDLGMEFRPYYLSKYWVEKGHKVTIIAASYSHLRIKQPDTKNYIQEQYVDGIKYVWIKSPAYSGNGIMRAINIITFVSILWFYYKKIINKSVDLVISSSTYPLDIYPAKKIARKYNAKLIFEPHDLWHSVLYLVGGMPRYHPFVMLMQKAEDDSCKYADAIVSLHPDNINHLKTRGCDQNRYYHLPNGVDIKSWSESGTLPYKHMKTIDALKAKNKMILMYVGSVALANGLDTLVKAAAKLEKLKKDISIVIVGDGPSKNELEAYVQKHGITNVIFLEKVNKELVPVLLSYADFTYVGFVPSPLYKYGISPNKLWDYMMSSKPIIMAIESSNDPVKEANCGYTISPGSEEEIVSSVLKLIEMSPDDLSKLGINGKKYVTKNNDYESLADRFISIANSL